MIRVWLGKGTRFNNLYIKYKENSGLEMERRDKIVEGGSEARDGGRTSGQGTLAML